MKEADEIVAVTVSSIKTAREKQSTNNQKGIGVNYGLESNLEECF